MNTTHLFEALESEEYKIGAVVWLTMDDPGGTSATELAYVLDATDTAIWFCIIHLSASGQNNFGIRVAPRGAFESVPVIGSGPHGLLHHWFAQEPDEDSAGGVLVPITYKMERIHDPQNRDLLRRFLRFSSADTIFAVLVQSVIALGLGSGKLPAARFSWASGLAWRTMTRCDRVLAARHQIVLALLDQESPARLVERVNTYLETIGEDHVWGETIPLIALAWDVLRKYATNASKSPDYRSAAIHLLEYALNVDLILQRSPLSWAEVEPLPNIENEYFERIKSAMLRDMDRWHWHDILRYRQTLTAEQKEILKRIHVSESELSQAWLRKWEHTHECVGSHFVDEGLLTPFEMVHVKDVLIGRFMTLDARAIANFVHRATGPWHKLFDDEDRLRALTILERRMNEGDLAIDLDELKHQYPLPGQILAIVELRLMPQAPLSRPPPQPRL